MSCKNINDLNLDMFDIVVSDIIIQTKLHKTAKWFKNNINIYVLGPYTQLLKNILIEYNLQTNNQNIFNFFQKMDQLQSNFYIFHSNNLLNYKHNTFFIDHVENFSINVLFTYHEHNQDLIYLNNNKSNIFLHNVLNISKDIDTVSTYIHKEKKYIVDQFLYMHLV